MSFRNKCCIAIALAVAIKKKKEEKKRIWVKDLLNRSNGFTQETLLNELKLSSADDFRNILRMDKNSYYELMHLVEPLIKRVDTYMREAISVNQRLAITLRFLATGDTFADMTYFSSVSRQSIGRIAIETCEAIIEALDDCIQIPATQDEWQYVSEEFYRRWNFPNCLGALGGMHIAMKKPHDCGLDFYNYKKFFSTLLMAVINGNYEFLMVDVGSNRKVPDEEVVSHTNFGKQLAENELDIPQPSALPSSSQELPYVFLADNPFQLTEHLMKPYAVTNLTEEQLIFNYRHSRAHRVVENTFGILSTRFGVLRRTLGLSPEKCQTILLACCYLHNYLIKKNTVEYIPVSAVDIENLEDGTIFEGSWREQVNTVPLQQTQNNNATNEAKDIRDKFCNYFNNEGQVPWQKQFVRKKNSL